MSKHVKKINGNPGDLHPYLVLYVIKIDIFYSVNLDVNPQGPHLHFYILRHHVLIIYAQLLWRTRYPTENSLKAGVMQHP